MKIFIDTANIDEINPLNNDIPVGRESIGDWLKIGFDFLFLIIDFS